MYSSSRLSKLYLNKQLQLWCRVVTVKSKYPMFYRRLSHNVSLSEKKNLMYLHGLATTKTGFKAGCFSWRLVSLLTSKDSFSPQREIIASWLILPKLTPKQCRWLNKTTGKRNIYIFNIEAGSILCNPVSRRNIVNVHYCRYFETFSSVVNFISWQHCAYALMLLGLQQKTQLVQLTSCFGLEYTDWSQTHSWKLFLFSLKI